MTPDEARRTLTVVTGAAVSDALAVLERTRDRQAVMDVVPGLIAYYSDGSSALAAEYYDESRLAAGARGRFVAEPVVRDRAEKIRRGLLWATAPLVREVLADPASRLAEVVQLEVARPNRDTILENRRRDPEAAGWKRIARGDGCKFCQMLAAKGAIYKRDTARFAAHENCNCTAQPMFRGEALGPEASAMQYMASGRTRTAKERARLRDYLNGTYPDSPG